MLQKILKFRNNNNDNNNNIKYRFNITVVLLFHTINFHGSFTASMILLICAFVSLDVSMMLLFLINRLEYIKGQVIVHYFIF